MQRTVRSPKRPPGTAVITDKLLVKDFPRDVGADHVKAYFTKWGRVRNVALGKGRRGPDWKRGSNDTRLWVTFERGEDAVSCYAEHNIMRRPLRYKGASLRVSYSQ